MKLQENERQRIESHCVANFATFVPKFCFTFPKCDVKTLDKK